MQSTLTEQQTLVKRIRDGYQSNQPYVITPEDDLILNDVYSSLAEKDSPNSKTCRVIQMDFEKLR